jgi:hypothetical protein
VGVCSSGSGSKVSKLVPSDANVRLDFVNGSAKSQVGSVGEKCSYSKKERCMRIFGEAVRDVESTPGKVHGYKTVCENSGVSGHMGGSVMGVRSVCGGMCGVMESPV